MFMILQISNICLNITWFHFECCAHEDIASKFHDPVDNLMQYQNLWLETQYATYQPMHMPQYAAQYGQYLPR